MTELFLISTVAFSFSCMLIILYITYREYAKGHLESKGEHWWPQEKSIAGLTIGKCAQDVTVSDFLIPLIISVIPIVGLILVLFIIALRFGPYNFLNKSVFPNKTNSD